MNDDTTNGPLMSGDDELAKTLNGGLKFGDTPASDDSSGDDTPPSLSDLPKPSQASDFSDDTSNDDRADDTTTPTTSASSDLEKLKSSALDDLKPLVGKLNLSPEEKFDTFLLIIRSTDDQSLLVQAHAAAKEISDDTKRAQALLDIIKEVDYFNGKK